MKKGFKAAILTALLTIGATVTAFAGTWQTDGVTYKYLKDDGTYAVNEWQSNQGLWYHLDANGAIQTGWIQDNGKWYYLEPTGAMRLTDLAENGVVYQFDLSGACLNPDGGAANVANNTANTANDAASEQAYLYSVMTLLTEIETASQQVDAQLSVIGNNDIEGAKQALNSLKLPFYNFLSVPAPQRYQAADLKMKAGCQGMINFMDGCIMMIDGAANGTVTADNLMSNLAYLEQVMNTAIKDFEAGATLLDAVR